MSESFYSSRFDKEVWLTNHAIESMAKRNVTLKEVHILIETGTYKAKDGTHAWVYTQVDGRSDNLMCAAVVKNQAIIVKTIMINWKERSQQ